jgi:hypothetical protein
MLNADWIAVFRQLPPDLHPLTVLVLHNRTEITIETLLRVEPTFLAIRGRMGGTTDGGLLFVVPYDQLAAVYLYKVLGEAEVNAIFGPPKSTSQMLSRSALAARQAAGTTGSSQAAPQPAPAPAPAPVPIAAAMPAFGRPPEATAVARNNLLERLRAARQAATPPNGK